MKNTAIEPSWLNPAIWILTLATAVIHFSLSILMGRLDVMFTLNGLGYLALLAALYLDLPVIRDNRRLIRIILIGFTLVTIIAWVFLGDKTWWLGWVTKLIELALVLLLLKKRP